MCHSPISLPGCLGVQEDRVVGYDEWIFDGGGCKRAICSDKKSFTTVVAFYDGCVIDDFEVWHFLVVREFGEERLGLSMAFIVESEVVRDIRIIYTLNVVTHPRYDTFARPGTPGIGNIDWIAVVVLLHDMRKRVTKSINFVKTSSYVSSIIREGCIVYADRCIHGMKSACLFNNRSPLKQRTVDRHQRYDQSRQGDHIERTTREHDILDAMSESPDVV